ncbi:hypothetical protein GCM10010149_08570 [Nonomuraea roseoviolacea subsp. roseoviolacea]|uniref:Uncharacterized protein n=2 Tax=Nonomuraea TaxID=83681 RepID=A0A7Y6I6V0_9ACTN|nr:MULTISPECIES: hypothetical protein [Nonomuraea]MCP2350797.1 hypothetical protein [Nonomuraea roseoviolacea subsp. carminata]NUW32243.1 hypothetical protein [Nonomuraea montanisoli]
MPDTPREHTRTYFLGKLAQELEARGLAVTLRAHPPALRVSDPDTALLAETVDCVPLSDGWFYRWSWGEIVGLADDPGLAAHRIARVLTGR